eukprot:scaffold3875_cov123-Cylindrotheca_fusiformis.AAC.22
MMIEPETSQADMSSLSLLHNHNCLLIVLGFLDFEDVASFALTSKGCNQVRCHPSLDQTRSGTIRLGNGASDTAELISKVSEENWADVFSGRRTHLRLEKLPHLSPGIDAIDEDFVHKIVPLKGVESLDCSVLEGSRNSTWLLEYAEYVDKGLAQGLVLSLLFPNIREINMDCLPLTTLGVALIAETNPALEVVRWQRSIVWPISNEAETYMKAFRNVKELYLDQSKMVLCSNLDPERLWSFLAAHNHRLTKVSLRGTRSYTRNGRFDSLSQETLMKFVRFSGALKWFRSDLTMENIAILKQERPDITFCQ